MLLFVASEALVSRASIRMVAGGSSAPMLLASPPLEASSGEAGSGADSLAVKSDFWGMEKDLKRYVERENAKMDAILDRLAKLENERSESGLTTITRH